MASRAGAAELALLGIEIDYEFKLIPGLVSLNASALNVQYSIGSRNLRSSQDGILDRIRRLRRSGLFEYVEPDFRQRQSRVPGDARFSDDTLWGLRNRGSEGGMEGADIDAVRAWDITTGSTNVIVAIIDSGIRYTHRELAGQMWRNLDEIPGNGVDDDQDGYADNIFGMNAVNGSGDPHDDSGHGTHVAGTIGAAANDGNPHVGVAWQVRLMACKFLTPDGFGLTSDAIRAIEFAIGKGARIINASWETGAFSQGLFDAIAKAGEQGVLFVTAAGNDLGDLDATPSYPACYDLDNIITVAALDRRDRLAAFSNYGNAQVDVAAPGVEIHSTFGTSDSAYWTISGTSMAAPYVSGVAALILSRSTAALLPEVSNRILASAAPVESLRGKTRTGGRLNAYGALTASPDGSIELAVTPHDGAELRAGSLLPMRLTVTDLVAITNATITAQVQGSEQAVAFRNDEGVAGAMPNGAIYTSFVTLPNRTGPLSLRVQVSAPEKKLLERTFVYAVIAPPANDDRLKATQAPSVGGVFSASNRLATLEPGEPLHAKAPMPAGSVWWRWSPESRTSVIVDTAGSSFDTVLAVYSSSSASNLEEVASVDDSEGRKQGYVIFEAVPDRTYYIAVAGFSTQDLGSIHLRIQPLGGPDNRKPEISISNPLSGLTVTNIAENRIVVTGTAWDEGPNASGVEEILIRINDKQASRASGTTNWSNTISLDPGENAVQIVAVDFSHNVSDVKSLTVHYRPLICPNDLFANSVELSGRFGAAKAVNSSATSEYDEPRHGVGVGGKSIWWHFTPATDGLLVLSTDGSSFDTVLSVYAGLQVTNLNRIAQNDEAHAGANYSQIRQAVKANQTLRIAVDSRTSGGGAVTLFFSFSPMKVYELKTSSTLGGTVTPRSGFYPANERTLVTAAPALGFQFDAWDGSVRSLEDTLLITMNRDVELVGRFRPYEFTDGFETGDLNRLEWKNSGAAPWVVQSETAAFGRFAARSGSIRDGEVSVLAVTGICRAGNGSFTVDVSCESGWDFLEFRMDGRSMQKWSGEVRWQHYQFSIPAGVHELEWRYSKDAGGLGGGRDAGFLDNLELPLVVPANLMTPARLKILPVSAGQIRIHVIGQIKQEYWIQSSTDCVNWTTISTTIATNGASRIDDTISDHLPMRFYRAIAR